MHVSRKARPKQNYLYRTAAMSDIPCVAGDALGIRAQVFSIGWGAGRWLSHTDINASRRLASGNRDGCRRAYRKAAAATPSAAVGVSGGPAATSTGRQQDTEDQNCG